MSSEPEECPLRFWKIDHIINNSTNKTEFEIVAEINNLGQITVLEEKPKNDYLLFIYVSNAWSEIWSEDFLIVHLEKYVNLKPSFLSKVENQVFTMKSLNDTFVYKIPDFKDPENKNVMLTVQSGL